MFLEDTEEYAAIPEEYTAPWEPYDHIDTLNWEKIANERARDYKILASHGVPESDLSSLDLLEYRKVTRLGIERRPSGHIPDALTTELSSLVGFNHRMNFYVSATPSLLDFHNKVTSETLISDNKVRSQVCNNVKSSLIMVYYLY